MIDKTKYPESDMHDHVVARSPFKPSPKAAIFLVESGPKIDPKQIVEPTEQLRASAALFAAQCANRPDANDPNTMNAEKALSIMDESASLLDRMGKRASCDRLTEARRFFAARVRGGA